VGRVLAVEERLLGGVPGGSHGAPAAQRVIGRGGGRWGLFCRWAPALGCRVEFPVTRHERREGTVHCCLVKRAALQAGPQGDVHECV
jgi:hypothetical protein